MKDQDKTKEELISELVELRRRISELEEKPPESRQVRESPDVWRERMLPNELPEDDITETIDLTKSLTQDITSSGSFDIRGDIWRTTFGKILQALPMPALLIDASYCITSLNQAWAVVSPSYQSVEGRPFTELFSSPSSAERVRSLVESIFSTRKSRVAQAMLRIDSATIWCQMAFRPIRIMNERLILVLANDLTRERKEIENREKTEKKLRESEERYRVLIENLNEGILVVKDGAIKFVNPRSVEFTGYSAEELTSRSFLELVHPDDREMVMQLHGKRMAGDDTPYQYTLRIVAHDESVKWLFMASRIISWHGERVTLVSATDITSTKAAEDALRDREALLAAVLDALPDVVGIQLPDHTITRYNRAGYELLGLPPEQAHGRKCYELIGRSDQCQPCATSLALKSKRSESLEKYVPELDRHLWCTSTPLVDQSGEVRLVIERLLDITERKTVELALQESEKRFRSLIDQAADAIFVHDLDGRFLEVNQQGCASLGYTRDELLFMSVTDVDPDAVPRGDRDRFWPSLPATFEAKHKRKDGTTFPVEIRLGAIEFGEAKVVLAMARDLTDRKKAEEALERSQAELTAIFNSISDAIVFTGTDRRIVRVNPAFTAIWGYEPEEAVGRTTEFLYANRSDYEEQGRRRYHIAAGPEPTLFEATYRSKMGTIFPAESLGTQVKDSAGNVIGFIGVHRDITDRKKAEETLRKSEEFNRRLVEHAPFGIVYMAGNGTIEYVNPAAKRIGRIPEDQVSPVLGRNILELPGIRTPSEVQEGFRRLLAGEFLSDFEVPYTSSMGRDTVLLVAATPRFGTDGAVAGATLMFTDISERKRAEELQRETARYRAVADLAGGVAHNFNNLLHIVMGHLELALMDLEAGDYAVVKDGLEKVLKSSRFGAEVVRRLQKFTQRRDSVKAVEIGIFDLSEVARQAVEVSEGWLTDAERKGIKVSLHTRLKEGCLVNMDKNEIFEVLVNLVRNAVEALPTGGDVDVTSAVEGNKVVLQVRDTGIGICQENLGRLFNPFFTTKAEAGAGLSLASGRKIVEDYGGEILVDSVEGQGTSFTVLFPLTEKLPEPTKALPERDTEQPLTILVIDDMEVITDLMKSALTAYGHAVLTALSGEEGIEIFKENPPDVAICDLGMPGMSGWEVGRGISAICRDRGVPKTPFILLTAWAGQEMETEQIVRSGVDAVVGKPLKIQDILEVIREVVEKSRSKDSEG